MSKYINSYIQSYNYAPNPITKGVNFILNFTDKTGTINGLNTYNLKDVSFNVLASYNNTNQIIYDFTMINPSYLAFDSSGNLYCANNSNFTINKITPTGSGSTFVFRQFLEPRGLAFDSSGNLYCANINNNTINKITPAGIVSTFVSSGLNGPNGLAFDSSGNLYCANNNNTISKITPAGIVSTFVSSGLNKPTGLAFDSSGNLYCANNNNNTISKITPAGIVSTFVSTGLNVPFGLAFDSFGNLYCTNYNNSNGIISKITPTGVVSTIFVSSAPKTTYTDIYGLAFDSSGNLYSSNTNILTNYNSIISIAITYLQFKNATSNTLTNNYTNSLNIYDSYNNKLNIYSIRVNVGNTPCFLIGSKILTNNGYVPIEELRKGDLVKTLLNGYVPIYLIGKREIYHDVSNERIPNQLYKFAKNSYPEIFEDLVLTGFHSILVDYFISEEQRDKAIEINSGRLCITDNKYRLPSCIDINSTIFENEGLYTVYHLALENENYYYNYGIYANGLLVETCSKRYLNELSDMVLIE